MHPGYPIGEVYLHTEPIDFRKQMRGLATLVEGELQMDPFGEALFVFVNRRRTSLKALYWHRNGFCLWQKHLEEDRFAWPAPGAFGATCRVTVQQLQWLLEGFDIWRHGPHKLLNYQSVI